MKLIILMWKHLTVRIRRFIHTPIEFLSPIIFFLILFCFKDKINPTFPGTQTDGYSIRNTEAVTQSKLPQPGRLLYTPSTTLTDALMDNVREKFNLKRLDSRTVETAGRGCYALTNITEITAWLGKVNNNDAIIIFHDLDEREDWSNQLSYTVRMRGVFHTHEIFAYGDSAATPHRAFGEQYYQLMSLQWAIDTSFIQTLTGTPVPQSLLVQEFPAVGRADQPHMVWICELIIPLCWLSLVLVFVFLMARLLEERTSGIQELVKMVGVSSNLYGISHFLNALPGGVVYSVVGTVLLTASATPVLPNSSGLLVLVILALHFVSIVAMAFVCSYISDSTQYTTTVSVFSYIGLVLPANYWDQTNVRGVGVLTGLLPHAPVHWLWKEVAAKEQYGEGLTFGDAFSSHSPTSGPVMLGALFLIIQTVVLFAFAWYLARVRPGKYGQAQPWNFLFQKQYWTKNEVKPESEMDEEVPIAREAKYFEDPPKNMQTGIKVENVTKVFPKHTALNNVSLDVYKGEITVLLGHNGAGKTTLMSIITGMMSATEGRVLINGVDTTKSSDEVRMQMGLCPQHNLFFPDLTVLEHAMFFALLKGGTFKTAREKSYELLETLGLREKADVHSAALSGGMKRRLQLACALSGGAEVLVLDEPTSGLDVETRRELWDLLLSLRGNRTVLLTTHFMEEADALGDRVAALHLGRLRCHATTMYLKKAIGTGYRISFTTNGPPRERAVTAAVTAHVPEASLKDKTANSLSYNLPAAASGNFPELFSALEDGRSELGIETIGVGVSTLEEVFLKLCSDTDTTFAEDDVDPLEAESTFNRVTGAALYCRQLWVLLKRHAKYAYYRKYSFLSLQVVLPVVMICVFTSTSNNYRAPPPDSSELSLDLGLYSALRDRRVLCDVSGDVGLRTLNDKWPGVDFIKNGNITGEVLRATVAEPTDYAKYIAGIEINDTHAKALYTTTVRHAGPVSVNLLTSALATRSVPGAGAQTFRARFDPISPTDPTQRATSYDSNLVQPKNLQLSIMYALAIVFVVLATNINAVSLLCRERASGARHLHLLAGCPASLHWAAAVIFHGAACAATLLVAVAIAAAAIENDHTINAPDAIMSMLLVLLLGSLSFFALSFLASCYLAERGCGIVLVTVLIIFGLITTTVKTAAVLFQSEDSLSFGDALLALASYVMPPHAATVAFGKVVYGARINAYCRLNRDRCPALYVQEAGFDTEKCCAGQNPQCYMCINQFAPGKEMIILTAQFFVYMTLVLLTQLGWFNSLADRIWNIKYRNSAQNPEAVDEIVRAESIYVSKQIALPKEKIRESDHAMLASDLHKNYVRLFGKSCNAVKGVSFSVKKGECFGLLGVNGAGKSTTFKMLTAEECPTKGDIYANGFFRQERQSYLRSLGYCPQFFGLDDFQSGHDNLELLLTLRGLNADDVAREVKTWIEIVGLEKYSRRAVCEYSGGCTRRLAAGAALCSGAALTLLDEPTAGVDVSARRRVWRAVRRALRQHRALVITSHSMDEMESLCSRIAIMSAGAVRAVGTAAELRAQHAAGHAVLIKVSASGDEVDGAKSDLAQLKSSLHSKFNCTLKDEHKTMLHYHINETMRYSSLFSALEELKRAHPGLLQDYSVTETTLEEVFLSFAREQRDAATRERTNHIV